MFGFEGFWVFWGCLRNSQYCVYLIIECLKRYYLLCFSLVYVLLVLVIFLWLLDLHGLWRVQGGHALYIYARVHCYCYCIYMYIYNAYVAYVRRMCACITFHAGVIHKHWCLVSFHLFSFYFYAMMYVVRFLLFIWLIDVCMVCMLFIRLSPSSDLSVFYILLLLWLTTMLLLFWFCFGSTNDTFKYLQLLYFKIVFVVYFNHMPFCRIPSHSAHTAPN